MKNLITVLSTALLVSGCANLPGQSQPPYYDYQQQALIGPGYPIERVPTPLGFQFESIFSDSRQQAHAGPGDTESAQLQEYGVAWATDDGATAVATALHQGLDMDSRWRPWMGADGYEFVSGHRFQHLHLQGPYGEVAGDPDTFPANAPECGVSANFITYSPDRRKRTVFTYAEGIECSQLATLGIQDRTNLRHRAYRAFGLR